MKKLIMFLMIILLINFILTLLSIEFSPLYLLSNYLDKSVIDNPSLNYLFNETTDTWAIRGQIGDIMSGHFSALAFLAVALSILFQSEANKQMKESIDKQESSLIQQSEALAVQSRSLEAQIEELKASRKESSKQTEEFFISNMNVKMDRYYKQLEKIEIQIKDNPTELYWGNKSYIDMLESSDGDPRNDNYQRIKQEVEDIEYKYDKACELIEVMLSHQKNIKDEKSRKIFIDEFSIMITSNKNLVSMIYMYAHTSKKYSKLIKHLKILKINKL